MKINYKGTTVQRCNGTMVQRCNGEKYWGV